MIQKTPKNSGFTLIELMVAVAIVGILASMAAPAYYTFQIQAARAEMKQNLNTISTLMEVYHTENDTYDTGATGPAQFYGKLAGSLHCGLADSLAGTIGFRIPDCASDNLRYGYQINTGTTGTTTYVVEAWSIDEGSGVIYGNPPISRFQCTSNNYYDHFYINEQREIIEGNYLLPGLGAGNAIALCNKQ